MSKAFKTPPSALYGFNAQNKRMESIDFDFLTNENGEESQDSNEDFMFLQATPQRDPRVVRSIGEVADAAEVRLASRQARGIHEPAEELGFDILSLHESELESLWPTWGERRVASLGRGIPLGVTITPQHLPRAARLSGGEARPISYK